MRLSLLWLFLVFVGCAGEPEVQAPDPVEPVTDSNGADTSSDDDTLVDDEPGQSASDTDFPSDPWKRVRDRINFSGIEHLSFTVGTADGVVFTHHRGDSTSTTPYASASSIKWVTAAVILRLVEEGVLELDANPQAYLDWWTSDPADARSRVTIRQLLAFTSGLSGTPFGDNTPSCLNEEETTIDACAQLIYAWSFDYDPGEAYFYGPSHMQVLAAIAEAATGESWAEIYRTRVAEPVGMESTVYNWPSLTNPRLSAGAVTNLDDFQRFAHAMLVNYHWPTTWSEMVRDHTPNDSVQMAYSPFSEANRGLHYGLGVWLECPNPDWEESCNTVGVLSASGLFGFHLWVDTVRGHYAVLAMEDDFNGWQTSLQLSWVLREDVAAAVSAE